MEKTDSIVFDLLVKALVLIKFYTIWIIVLVAIPLFLLASSFILPVVK